MRPGERQVADNLGDIRKDHKARYEWAAKYLGANKTVIDVGCGVGYGTHILAKAGLTARGYEIDQEAVDYANANWKMKGTTFRKADARHIGPFRSIDGAICFEMLEHVEDPEVVLNRIGESTDTLICSVPNESVFPHRGKILYHHRHYTAEEFEELLNFTGWQVDEWFGQHGPESDVEKAIQGRTLIAVCSRPDTIKSGMHKELPPPALPIPRSVAIVAMGRSASTYLNMASTRGGRHMVADETWAINSMGAVIQHDMLFHMDDCKIQEARAEASPGSNVWGLVQWLKGHDRFFTSKKYDDYPGAMAFPLTDVINSVGSIYFNSTVAYAVAYAIHLGVERISLYGVDYSYANMHKAESGRGCVEFYLGIAAAKGIQIEIASDSTLMDANVDPSIKPYGYDAYDVEFNQTDEGMEIVMKDRDELPTPEEMEARYNHEPKQQVV
jgi:SAM-dependent methyltransferase